MSQTIPSLADQVGISHAEGRRIAVREFPALRHFHKSQPLLGYQAARLRPLFLAARSAPRPPMLPGLVPEEASMSDLPTRPVIQGDGMTIREVSEALGVSRDLIEKRIRELMPDRMRQGETTFLSESEVTAIKLRIEQNSSLATSDDRRKLADMPKTTLEKQLIIRQAMALQDEIIAELQGQLALAAPKIEAFDRLLDASGSLCISDVAKQLGRPPLKFFADLERDGFIFRRAGDWLPVQGYVERGYFEVKTRTYGEPPNEHITRQTRVTPKGLARLAEVYPTAGQVTA